VSDPPNSFKVNGDRNAGPLRRHEPSDRACMLGMRSIDEEEDRWARTRCDGCDSLGPHTFDQRSGLRINM